MKDWIAVVSSYLIAYLLFGWTGVLVWFLLNLTFWGVM